MNRGRQQGVALLTVLLLVAVMTVLMVAILDDVRFGLRRAENVQSRDQAEWYALGAETLARQQLEALPRARAAGAARDAGWHQRPLVFPVEHGAIQARVFDQSDCFNLNSVVEGMEEQLRRREVGIRQFHALAEAVGIPAMKARGLGDALADWIDSDGAPGPARGEDSAYQGRGYLTSATLLAEPNELRAIQGFDAETYARLRPFVCALPTARLSPVNVNLLDAEDAPILVMLTEGRLDLRTAADIISSRPAGGWKSHAEFWAHPRLVPVLPSHDVLEQVDLDSRFFGLVAEVDHLGAQVVLSSLLHLDGSGEIRTVARRWTLEE